MAPWLPIARTRATATLAICTTIAAATLLALGPPNQHAQAIIMLAAVALLGLPHGAYDQRLGRLWLKPRLKRAWAPAFAALYLAAAALALAFWLLAPPAGLAALLALGVIHWGLDDLESPPRGRAHTAWLALARGTPPVALPCLFHPDDVAAIFNALVFAETFTPESVRAAAGIAVIAAAPALLAQTWRLATRPTGRTDLPLMLAELTALTLWFAVAPPLLAFTIYFCCWHSLRHAMRSAADLDATNPARAARRYLQAVAAPTLATIAIAALAFSLIPAAQTFDADAARIVFIGLFALTIPHVTLEWCTPAHEIARHAQPAHPRTPASPSQPPPASTPLITPHPTTEPHPPNPH